MIFTVELNAQGRLVLCANGVCLPGIQYVEIDSSPLEVTTMNVQFIVHPKTENHWIFRDKDGTRT